jgi:hypothetical protein
MVTHEPKVPEQKTEDSPSPKQISQSERIESNVKESKLVSSSEVISYQRPMNI